VGPRALTRLGLALADLVIGQHCARRHGRARRITIDLDPTDDPTHGQQEFAFFNGHYDTWCYLPLLGFVTFDDEAEQYLVLALLRPGNSPAKRGAIGRLRTLFRKLRAAFPGASLRVRLDGGFAGEELLAFLEAEGVEYLVAMGSNRRLAKRVRRLMGKARMQSKASGATEHEFGETRYAARTWSHTRRIIMKAEVVRHPDRAPKNNPRFVVTNLAQTPAHVYRLYRERGDVENRIKELKDGLALDRLSCSRFLGNQFRVLLTAAAYILMQGLRLHATGTACATAQVMTLRERLLKVAVWVERSVRRIVLHFPTAFPWRPTWRHIACAVGATP
jgi:DNA-directed RNA polymerase subunit N (RpoN/RPB10)